VLEQAQLRVLHKDLARVAADAMICTFCAECVANRPPGGQCPNCGGGLARRPVRPAPMLVNYPRSTRRLLKPHAGCAD